MTELIFFSLQILDTLLTSSRASNYGELKATVASRIYKKACSVILGYQTLLNTKVTGRFCLLRFSLADVGSRFANVLSFVSLTMFSQMACYLGKNNCHRKKSQGYR